MAARIRAATPAGSCPDCLSWGPSYGSRSYCRACYDFTRRHGRGERVGCRRIIAVRRGAVAAGPVTADGGGQRLPALIDDSLGHLPRAQPRQCGHLGQRRPLQAGHDRAEAELGGGGGEALAERPLMSGGDLTEIGAAGHQVVGARTQPPRYDQPAGHPPVLQRQGALGGQRQPGPSLGPDPGEERAGHRGDRVTSEHPGGLQVAAVGVDQVLHGRAPGR
jgi:hypothetical protein